MRTIAREEVAAKWLFSYSWWEWRYAKIGAAETFLGYLLPDQIREIRRMLRELAAKPKGRKR